VRSVGPGQSNSRCRPDPTEAAGHAFTVGGKRVLAQLNVNKLFDRRHFINSAVYDASPRFGAMPGQPRTVLASLRLKL